MSSLACWAAQRRGRLRPAHSSPVTRGASVCSWSPPRTIQTRWCASRDFVRGLNGWGGWQGRNVSIEYRFAAGQPAAFQALAKELVSLELDAILAHSTPIAAALQRETRTIPIVFVNVSDPIGSGFIANLARPGGNLTGLLLYEEGMTGKWLAMLKEIVPRLENVAAIGNPKTTPYEYFLRSAKAAAPSLTIKIEPSAVENAGAIERAIQFVAREPNGGVLVLPDSSNIAHRDLLIGLAAQHRLPAVYFARLFVAAGGLMSYGTDVLDAFRQATSYINAILRGAAPSELPVQAPTRFETALNLKTAKTLGLAVPHSLLLRADEVIE